MSATYELFSKWKNARNLTSDYQGAMQLRVGRATVSQWKNGRNGEAHLIAKMCDDIGEPLQVWLPRVQAEREMKGADKKVWMRLAKGFGAAASIAMATALFLAHNLPSLYIMSNRGDRRFAAGTVPA